MADKTVKQLPVEIITPAADDWFLVQRDADNVTGKIKASNLFAGGWTPLSSAPSAISFNGNRSYDLTLPGTSLLSILSPGMRLRAVRMVPAPTQSTRLNGTSQYWSKTSPAGLSFTDDFVQGAWVKLDSYPASGNATIISRFNGTSGFALYIFPDGRCQMIGYNGGSTNTSFANSYQKIPVGRWVHIAAQLDMSAFTNTPTTTYLMIDGVDVPLLLSRSGSNPTSLVQAGNLEVGSTAVGQNLFPGAIAQAFVSSAKITQSAIRSIISQGLTSAVVTTNNIVSAYSFDGNANDLNTTNANTLTASSGATTTNGDSPFGTQGNGTMSSTVEYAIIQAVAATTDLFVSVQVPEGCMLPTTGGITSMSFSSQEVPYNFPRDDQRFMVKVPLWAIQTNNPNGNTWNNNLYGAVIQAPKGRGYVGHRLSVASGRPGSAALGGAITLSTTTSSEVSHELTAQVPIVSSQLQAGGNTFKEDSINPNTLTPYYVNYYYDGASGAQNAIYIFDNATQGRSSLYWRSAYV